MALRLRPVYSFNKYLLSVFCIVGSVLKAGGIDHTGKVLTEPSQDNFLSFKVIVSNLCLYLFTPFSRFFPSFSLPPPPRPFLLCLSSRYPPFGLLGLHPP